LDLDKIQQKYLQFHEIEQRIRDFIEDTTVFIPIELEDIVEEFKQK